MGDSCESEFELYSLQHQAVYEADATMVGNVQILCELIEKHRLVVHQDALIDVGATTLASKLSSGSQRVTQGTGFRRQLSKKSDGSDDNNLANLLYTSIVHANSESFLD